MLFFLRPLKSEAIKKRSILDMEFSEFLRIFEVRAGNLSWLLGAGCSISAGIPSAADIVWDCKSRIYCSELGVSRSAVSDISNPQIQKIIQDHLDAKGLYPSGEEDGDDYSYYFQKAIASTADRKSYIKTLMNKASPSYGHLILASLAGEAKAPIVWTTNFDKLYENAVFEIFGTANDLVVADLGEPEKAMQALNEKMFPLLVKLHGDFHSEKLKNTKPELQSQDEKMREALVKACTGYGLCVIGYSGRDKSILDVLTSSAQNKHNFPHGIFWLIRAGTQPMDSVSVLMETAQHSGIEANFIEINTFDEVFDGIRRYLGSFPERIEEILKPKASRKTDATILPESQKAPYLRLNALRIESFPSMCKLAKCKIGGYKEIKHAIELSSANIIARRISKGVIVFGADKEIKKAFESFDIESIQVHAIDPKKLEYVSEESKLTFDALCLAIKRKTGLDIEVRRDEAYVLANKDITKADIFNGLIGNAVTSVEGIVPSTTVQWKEACKIKLEYKFNRSWIVLSPRLLLHFDENHTEDEKNKAKSFVRERTAPRWRPGSKIPIGYNQVAASILSGWMSVIKQGESSGTVTFSVFGTGDGLDPQFEVALNPVVSGRSG